MAFHPYPQLIPSVFNLSGFAPPQSLTSASHWPWVDHPASGPGHATEKKSPSLGFAFATATTHVLTSPHAADSQAHSSKGTPSPHKEALTDCKHTVSGTISLPSRGTFHHSLTVLSAIGHTGYSGLPGGPGRFTADFTGPLLLGNTITQHTHTFMYGTLTLYGRRLHTTSTSTHVKPCSHRQTRTITSHNPTHATTAVLYHAHGLATIRFRSPLLTESLTCFLFLRVLRCFTSPRNLHTPYVFRCR